MKLIKKRHYTVDPKRAIPWELVAFPSGTIGCGIVLEYVKSENSLEQFRIARIDPDYDRERTNLRDVKGRTIPFRVGMILRISHRYCCDLIQLPRVDQSAKTVSSVNDDEPKKPLAKREG